MPIEYIAPILLALARAFRGGAKVVKKKNVEWSWPKFIGSIVLLFVISLLVQLGLDAALVTDLVTRFAAMAGISWVLTDVMEDIYEGKK